ncbi:hypothetical protein GPECTOR_7g1090 [Gonium pectorale]|uniref:Uncharacterized protein n=1 Tax=Gonium pectorale TaxID=33097 RepID=A0A150GTL0_GONPE|nr:hypothetical protein GPECTOR_7g1090 [Gonium pectorale]|eukprot:KXZ53197.1 hypothetical protein GPECTOR_7g1090 [Gonium pectorale]
MYVKGSKSEIVHIGSADFVLVDGLMVSRQALTSFAAAGNGPGSGINVTSGGGSGRRALLTGAAGGAAVSLPPQAIVRTASFKGTPQRFSSRVDVRVLMEMEYLYIQGSAANTELALLVLGVARVPAEGSKWGSVVRIVTAAGTVTLDDVVLSFSPEVAPLFAEAGFRVSRTRRMLLGIYDVLGFFSWIESLDVFNLPEDEARPQLPSQSNYMLLKIYEPCANPTNVEEDRCVYEVTKADADTNRTLASGSIPTEEELNASIDSLINESSGGGGSHRRRRRTLRTAPHQRGLISTRSRRMSDAGSAGFEDLAGVELVDGVRYMTHNESAVSWQGLSRTAFYFATAPDYRKVELLTQDGNVHAWQEKVWPDGSDLDPVPMYCTSYSLPENLVSQARADPNSLVSFEWLGYGEVYDTSARHFRLTVRQPSTSGSQSPIEMPETLVMDYWDTLRDHSPLAFEVTHPTAGTLYIHVLEYRNLTSDDPATAPALFVPPAEAACVNNPTAPRLSSPFTVPQYDSVDEGGLEARGPESLALNETVRRRLMGGATPAEMAAESERRVAVWAQLDHANGTGEWPDWAIEAYGGVRPSQSRRDERMLQGKLTCSPTYSKTFDLSACRVAIGLAVYKYPVIEATCGGNIFGLPIALRGGFNLDMCTKLVSGCMVLSVGLEGYPAPVSYVVSYLGIRNIEIARLCGGYDGYAEEGFVYGSLTINLIFFKTELSAFVRFSKCCVWIEQARIEAFIGFTFWFVRHYWSLGTYTFADMLYLKGSNKEMTLTRNPIIFNLVTTKTVHEAWRYCARNYAPEFPYLSKGQQVHGFRTRTEEKQGGGDDTALNGLELSCMDETKVMVHEGYYGDWFGTSSCAPGDYIIGASMLVEDPVGGGDDTAANSIHFYCNQGGYIQSHSGGGGDDTALNGMKIACCLLY